MSATSSSRCKHFGACGGCKLQDLPYEEQLASKSKALGELFAAHWKEKVEVTPSPDVWYFRNKVELSFHLNYDRDPETRKLAPSKAVLGFKRRGVWYETIDVTECFLLSPELPALLGAMRGWALRYDVPVYDSKTRRGLLRHLIVREGKATGDRMVVLLRAPGECDQSGLVAAVRAAFPATTVVVGTNDSISDVAQAQTLETLAGPGTIEEALTVGGRTHRFRVSPFSFFQTNTHATEKLYGLIRDWVADAKPEMLWDLYGGAGTIGISVADLVKKIVSVETVASATEDGRANAAANGVGHIEFVNAPVERFVRTSGREGAAIVDPPRSGLHPKALDALVTKPYPRLLYVSCNPKILARELEELKKSYRLEWLRAVDLFPHTEHVEVVASLRALW